MKRIYKISLSVIASILMLIYIFSSISLKESLELISKVEKNYVLMFFLTSLMMSVCSSWRYNILLFSMGYRAPVFSMYLVVLVRNMGSDLLPARLGTLVYIWLCNSRLAIPLHAALSSFAIAMLLDIIAMCPLFMLAAVFATGLADISPSSIVIAGFLLFLLVMFIAFIGIKTFDYIFSGIREKLKKSWAETLLQARKDLDTITDRLTLLRLVVLSLLVRIFKYLGLYFFLLALLVPLGFSYAELPFPKMFLGMSLAELSTSLPISGIAGLGAYQGAWIAAFTFLGFPLDLAKMTSISHHLFTQLYGYGLGLLALALLSLPVMHRKSALAAKKQKYFLTKLVSLIIIYILTILLLKPSAAIPDTHKTEIIKLNKQALEAIPDKYEVLFDANISGTFGIYRTDKQKAESVKLIDQPDRHEVFPDSSADGSFVVFADAKGAGRYALSEIKLLDLINNSVKLLSANGTFPSFLDNDHIIFERDRKKIIKLNLKSGQEEELFPAEMTEEWDNYSVVKPRISSDGNFLVFTSEKKSKWSIWLVDLAQKKISFLTDGCQPRFTATESQKAEKIIFIENALSLAGSGIWSYDLSAGIKSLLEDKDGSKGHEYFPYKAGENLIFAASSSKSHSHEDGSYNLFIVNKNGVKISFSNQNSTFRWPSLIKIN